MQRTQTVILVPAMVVVITDPHMGVDGFFVGVTLDSLLVCAGSGNRGCCFKLVVFPLIVLSATMLWVLVTYVSQIVVGEWQHGPRWPSSGDVRPGCLFCEWSVAWCFIYPSFLLLLL